MTENNKIIIGGGITGLLWKYYNPEYEIISPDLGGTLNQKYLVLIHDTPSTRRLFRDLNFPIVTKICKIGYSNQGFIRDYQTEEMNKITIQKKMTEWDRPLDKTFIPSSREMSTTKLGDNKLPILDIEPSVLLEKIEKNANIKNGYVTQITPVHIFVKLKDSPEIRLKYDEIISTIAAPYFWSSYRPSLVAPSEFKSLPITNIETKVKPKEFDSNYDIIYYDDHYLFSRISKIKDSYFIEYTGVISKELFYKYQSDAPIESYNVVKFGRIFQIENESPQSNIIFSGRFSQWKYGITMEHTLNQIYNYLERKK
jgi:hypothetical protein